MFKKIATAALAAASAFAMMINPAVASAQVPHVELSAEQIKSYPEPASWQVFYDSNNIREEFGLEPTGWDPGLAADAQAWAQRLADTYSFSHDTAHEVGFFNGENLYWSDGHSLSSITEGWMNSDSHRDNLLAPEHQRQGTGIAVSADGETYFVVQRFLDF